MEKRHHRGCRDVIKRGSSFGRGVCRGTRPGGGNRWGAGVFGLFRVLCGALTAQHAERREKAYD